MNMNNPTMNIMLINRLVTPNTNGSVGMQSRCSKIIYTILIMRVKVISATPVLDLLDIGKSFRNNKKYTTAVKTMSKVGLMIINISTMVSSQPVDVTMPLCVYKMYIYAGRVISSDTALMRKMQVIRNSSSFFWGG